MISIITAIHNQLNMNKIFLHYLRKYTQNEYELIIIDNVSNDGSPEFFEKNGAVLIRNKNNYSYPYCQNQGIKIAKYDKLLFLNNDVIVSKNWDKNLFQITKNKKLEMCFVCTNDRLQTPELTHKISNKWKAIKNPLNFLFGQKRNILLLMHKIMYGNWESYTQKRYELYGNDIFEGISGSSVFLTKKAVEKIGLWDEKIQAADFDIFLRCKKRHLEKNDINLPVVVSGVYFHHYQRLTVKKKYPPFTDASNIISIKEKWTEKYAGKLLQGTGNSV